MHGRCTKRFLLAAISVVVLIAVGCRDSGSIPIGVVVPLSGNSANYGKSCQQGIDLALNEINASGGARGRQFRAIYEDDKAQAKDGLTAAQKLINIDHVQ